MSAVVLATSSAAFEQKVRRAFGSEMSGSLNRQFSDDMLKEPMVAAKQLAIGGPDIIAIGPHVPVDPALDIASAIEDEHPEIGIILIADVTPDLWEKALRSGVGGVLAPDAKDEQIMETFGHVLQTAKRRRRNLAAEAGVPESAGRVITVVAPKGGVGKTALATNLAVTLAARSEGRVALLDLDLQFGDVGSSLGLEPETTIADLARVPGGVSATSLKVFMTRRDDNLYALCAPISPAAEVPDTLVDKTIRLLTDDFEMIVIDTSAGLSEATLTAIDLSTDLVFLCDLSASALRALRKVIDTLDSLGVTRPNRYFVVNRADSNVGITPTDAEAIVGMKVDREIPSSEIVPRSMNYGNPVVEEAPNSAVALGFHSIAGLFVDLAADRKKRFRFGRSR